MSNSRISQPILTAEKLWPGGIPEFVRVHPTDDLIDGPEEWNWKNWTIECKGWCQFVEEEWVPMTDLNEEMRQRRKLIERWASADQAFRDSFHARSPERESALDYPAHLLSEEGLDEQPFVCLASVDKELYPDNYIRFVKNLILLYLHDNQGGGYHPMSRRDWKRDPSPTIPDILIDSSTTPDYIKFFSHHDLLINLYLHPADFRAVSMTRLGTVVFPHERSNSIYTVIDQDNLDLGRVAVMTFKPNGKIGEYANVFAWNFAWMDSYHYGLGWGYDLLFNGEDCNYATPYCNEPVKMDDPLMCIVDSLIQRRNLNSFGSRSEEWEDEIQRLAPGYLALEAQGREVEFDLADLWNEEGLCYNHYTLEQKKHYRETGSYFMPPRRFIPPSPKPVPATTLPPPSGALGMSFHQLFQDKLGVKADKK